MEILGGARLESSLRGGTCPKCNHTEIYFMQTDFYKILPRKFIGYGGLGERPEVDNFVCGTCGYAEFYVLPNSLEKVKKLWSRTRTETGE